MPVNIACMKSCSSFVILLLDPWFNIKSLLVLNIGLENLMKNGCPAIGQNTGRTNGDLIGKLRTALQELIYLP